LALVLVLALALELELVLGLELVLVLVLVLELKLGWCDPGLPATSLHPSTTSAARHGSTVAPLAAPGACVAH